MRSRTPARRGARRRAARRARRRARRPGRCARRPRPPPAVADGTRRRRREPRHELQVGNAHRREFRRAQADDRPVSRPREEDAVAAARGGERHNRRASGSARRTSRPVGDSQRQSAPSDPALKPRASPTRRPRHERTNGPIVQPPGTVRAAHGRGLPDADAACAVAREHASGGAGRERRDRRNPRIDERTAFATGPCVPDARRAVATRRERRVPRRRQPRRRGA